MLIVFIARARASGLFFLFSLVLHAHFYRSSSVNCIHFQFYYYTLIIHLIGTQFKCVEKSIKTRRREKKYIKWAPPTSSTSSSSPWSPSFVRRYCRRRIRSKHTKKNHNQRVIRGRPFNLFSIYIRAVNVCAVSVGPSSHATLHWMCKYCEMKNASVFVERSIQQIELFASRAHWIASAREREIEARSRIVQEPWTHAPARASIHDDNWIKRYIWNDQQWMGIGGDRRSPEKRVRECKAKNDWKRCVKMTGDARLQRRDHPLTLVSFYSFWFCFFFVFHFDPFSAIVFDNLSFE